MTGTKLCPQCGSELPADALQGLCPHCLLQGGLSSATPPRDSASTTGPGAAFSAPTPAELALMFPQLEIIELLGRHFARSGPPPRRKFASKRSALRSHRPMKLGTLFSARCLRVRLSSSTRERLHGRKHGKAANFGGQRQGSFPCAIKCPDGTEPHGAGVRRTGVPPAVWI